MTLHICFWGSKPGDGTVAIGRWAAGFCAVGNHTDAGGYRLIIGRVKGKLVIDYLYG